MTMFTVDYTDTFAGEANYSWMNRVDFSMMPDATDRQIVQEAKRQIGLTGVKCNREEWGDTIVLRPRGSCTIVLIT